MVFNVTFIELLLWEMALVWPPWEIIIDQRLGTISIQHHSNLDSYRTVLIVSVNNTNDSWEVVVLTTFYPHNDWIIVHLCPLTPGPKFQHLMILILIGKSHHGIRKMYIIITIIIIKSFILISCCSSSFKT